MEGMTGSFFAGLASASAEIFCLSSAGSMEEVTVKSKSAECSSAPTKAWFMAWERTWKASWNSRP